MKCRSWFFATLLFGALAPVPPADAEMVFGRGYPDRPLLGPSVARGAIIFNHGRAARSEPNAELPFYLDKLRDSGWDIFKLVRPWEDEGGDASVLALEEKARLLRAQGYHRIVSAGQSFGAWISFIVGTHAGVIDGIVAMAPARYGDWQMDANRYQRNAQIVSVADGVEGIAVMVFFFAKDDFDPGGRGDAMTRVLAAKQIPYVVIDRPDGFEGHGSANGTAFASRFAKCIVDFLNNAEPPGPVACRPSQPSTADIFARFPTAAQGSSKLAPVPSAFQGHWYGWYQNGGREVLLTVDGVSATGEAEGSYAVGPVHHNETARASRFQGSIGNGALKFVTASSKATVESRVRPDGQMDLDWTSADRRTVLKTMVRKLD